MDILVTPTSDPASYQLTDLLGRAAGEIQRFSPLGYYVRPERGSVLDGMARGMFPTLDDAMAAIAGRANGVCQIRSEEQQRDLARRVQAEAGRDEAGERADHSELRETR